MIKERVLLERAYGELAASDTTTGLLKEIRDFLSTPEPTQDEEPEKYATGLIGFIQYVPDAGMNFTLDEPDDDTYPFEPVYLHPAPRQDFVRLSEEEVSEILSSAHTPYEAICAVENRLVEKNK